MPRFSVTPITKTNNDNEFIYKGHLYDLETGIMIDSPSVNAHDFRWTNISSVKSYLLVMDTYRRKANVVNLELATVSNIVSAGEKGGTIKAYKKSKSDVYMSLYRRLLDGADIDDGFKRVFTLSMMNGHIMGSVPLLAMFATAAFMTTGGAGLGSAMVIPSFMISTLAVSPRDSSNDPSAWQTFKYRFKRDFAAPAKIDDDTLQQARLDAGWDQEMSGNMPGFIDTKTMKKSAIWSFVTSAVVFVGYLAF